jgi:hypothetical protein
MTVWPLLVCVCRGRGALVSWRRPPRRWWGSHRRPAANTRGRPITQCFATSPARAATSPARSERASRAADRRHRRADHCDTVAARRRRCWSRTRKPRRGERPTPVPAGTREGRPVPEPATVRSGRVVILSSSGSPAAAAWKLPAPAGTTGDDVRGVAEGAEFTGGAETLADRRGLREPVNSRRPGRTSSGRPHAARSDLRRAAPVLGVCRCRADHVGHRHVMRYCASSA